MSTQHLNLLPSITIAISFYTIPRVETVVGTGFDEVVDAIGRCPHHLCSLDTIELGKTVEKCGVVDSYQYRIVPSRCSDNGALHRAPFAVFACIIACFLELLQVSATDGKIGRIDGEPLAFAPFDGLMGKPSRGVLDRIGGALLIFQRIAPDIVFAPRILDLGAVACACRGGPEERQEQNE